MKKLKKTEKNCFEKKITSTKICFFFKEKKSISAHMATVQHLYIRGPSTVHGMYYSTHICEMELPKTTYIRKKIAENGKKNIGRKRTFVKLITNVTRLTSTSYDTLVSVRVSVDENCYCITYHIIYTKSIIFAFSYVTNAFPLPASQAFV